jgi:hypothetical protein
LFAERKTLIQNFFHIHFNLQETDKTLIEMARKSDTYYVSHAKAPQDSDEKKIANIAFDSVDKHDTLKDIESATRSGLVAQFGGKWMVIVTGSATNYASGWDSGIEFKYYMEFYTDGLRLFVYQIMA